jgi:hypothetical protein
MRSMIISPVSCFKLLFQVSWILTLFAHELPLMQVVQLWDFFLGHPPTIIITLAASIIILRVDAIKGCLSDQVSLLSAPPAVDLLRCKVL